MTTAETQIEAFSKLSDPVIEPTEVAKEVEFVPTEEDRQKVHKLLKIKSENQIFLKNPKKLADKMMENVLKRIKQQYGEQLKKQEQVLLDRIANTSDQEEGKKLYTEYMRLKQKTLSENTNQRMNVKMKGKASSMLLFTRPDLETAKKAFNSAP